MKLRNFIIGLIVLAVMLTSVSSPQAVNSASVDTVKFTNVKLSSGVEFNVPSVWKQTDDKVCTTFTKPSEKNKKEVSYIKVISSKQTKGTYKDLSAFVKAVDGNQIASLSNAKQLKSTNVKAAYVQGGVITDTVYSQTINFGSFKAVGRIERVYFKTTKGDYFLIQFTTSNFDSKKNTSLYDSVIPKLISTFKYTAASNTTSKRLFPVSKDGTFYYVDSTGNVVIKPNYRFADDFINGVARVAKTWDEDTSYIGENGQAISNKDSRTKNADLNFTGVREFKNNKLVDLSKNIKKYNTVEDGLTIAHEDYTLGDGFLVEISRAGGALKLYKNSKEIITDKLSNAGILLVVKYDDEKVLRVLYLDYKDGRFKTSYIDFNGKVLFDKVVTVTEDKTGANIDMTGLSVSDNLNKGNGKYFYLGYNTDTNLKSRAENSLEANAISVKTGASLSEEQKSEILPYLNKNKELTEVFFRYTLNNIKIIVSIFGKTDDSKINLKDINVNITLE